ncbi:hypothetical protein BDF22DRAFT_656777 [Syncephalis plumigaleata]|nr:hypothetical protein BDF22DRAFT_656777 [Syncephalis plumigaleata]
MNRARRLMQRIIPGGANCADISGSTSDSNDSLPHGDHPVERANRSTSAGWKAHKLKNVVTIPAKLTSFRRYKTGNNVGCGRFSTDSEESDMPRGLPLVFSFTLNDPDRPGRRGRRKGDKKGIFSLDTWRSKKHFRQLDQVSSDSVERELFKRLSRFEEPDVK